MYNPVTLPPHLNTSTPPPSMPPLCHQIGELSEEKPVLTSNTSPSICLHPVSTAEETQPWKSTLAPPPPPHYCLNLVIILSCYRSPFLLSSGFRLFCSLFSFLNVILLVDSPSLSPCGMGAVYITVVITQTKCLSFVPIGSLRDNMNINVYLDDDLEKERLS